MADRRLCIMFYIPVVTPWWFEHIIVHLIRKLSCDHDVHVLVPPLWRGTGIWEEQFSLIADLGHVSWHALDGPNHPKLRVDASDEEDLFALVHQIAPDLVLCRSADIRTPAQFPGTVRYIMEGAAPPFAPPYNWVTLSASIFDHGHIPSLTGDQERKLDSLAEPLFEAAPGYDRTSSLASLTSVTGPLGEAPLIALPLEFEHEQNFYRQHLPYRSNAEMIVSLAAQLPAHFRLLVTNHPLNDMQGDNRAVEASIEALGERAVFIRTHEVEGMPTEAVAHHCAAMVVGNSKSWSLCAYTGKPIVRLSRFTTGDWVRAYDDLASCTRDLVNGTARSSDPRAMRRWFAWHFANCVFDPCNEGLSAGDIVARAMVPVDAQRWDAGIERLCTRQLQEAA